MPENGHKHMDEFADAYVLPPGYTSRADLSRHGSIIDDPYGNPAAFARGKIWRSTEGDPTVRNNDCYPIHISSETTCVYDQTRAGGELELMIIDPHTAELFPAMNPDSPIATAIAASQLSCAPELMAACTEINFSPQSQSYPRALEILQTLRQLQLVVESQNALIMPLGFLPHRPLEPSDVTDHEYVRRMVFRFMGWEKARLFAGCSFQIHVEMFNTEIGLRSINYLQQLTPLFIAVSAAAPFANGHVSLSQADLPGLGSTRRPWHSVRYLARKYGSPSGGVIQFPAPDSLTEFIRLSQDLLESQEIHTLSRTLGHHADYRLRPDIGPSGTLELATPDTFGAHPLKLAAFTELIKAATLKIQSYLVQGREAELPPELFGQLTPQRLAIIDTDSISVSRDGEKADIHTPSGALRPLAAQWIHLLTWASQPDPHIHFPGLTQTTIAELVKCIQPVTPSLVNEYVDHQGYTSAAGFYASGIGTLSHWLHIRAAQLAAAGLSESALVANCMLDTAHAFHNYLLQADSEI